MKTIFSLLLTLVVASSALAQGKVRLVNDYLHLVYWEPAVGGQPYVLGQGGQTLRIELWSGTASGALSLAATTDFAQQPSPGTWNGMNVTLATAAGPTFFDIYIYDAAAGSWQVATTTAGHLYTTSGLFMANASGTIAYNFLANHNSPANSTWADGTWNMDYVSPGFRGAMVLGMPEPSVFALGCLGCALLLVRRRAVKEK